MNNSSASGTTRLNWTMSWILIRIGLINSFHTEMGKQRKQTKKFCSSIQDIFDSFYLSSFWSLKSICSENFCMKWRYYNAPYCRIEIMYLRRKMRKKFLKHQTSCKPMSVQWFHPTIWLMLVQFGQITNLLDNI